MRITPNVVQTVTMRDQYADGRVSETDISADTFRADLSWMQVRKVTLHRWSGEDRNGNPLRVAWACWTDQLRFGQADLSWYEISTD